MLTKTYNCQCLEPIINPHQARTMDIQLAASKTLAAGTVLGEVTASGKFDAYADAGAGGLDTARVILKYDCKTDGDGNIWLGDTIGDLIEALPVAPVYYTGDFRKGDLTGLTAAAVADLGRLIKGAVSDNEAILHLS